jgi:hypothetical protein
MYGCWYYNMLVKAGSVIGHSPKLYVKPLSVEYPMVIWVVGTFIEWSALVLFFYLKPSYYNLTVFWAIEATYTGVPLSSSIVTLNTVLMNIYIQCCLRWVLRVPHVSSKLVSAAMAMLSVSSSLCCIVDSPVNKSGKQMK